MEKIDITQLEPLSEDDVKVQYCDPSKCMFDCPPYLPNECGPLLSKKE